MSTLRVFLNAAPAAGRADEWTMFDENQRVMQSGCSPPDEWPAAEHDEAVLAASCVRIVELQLPPLSPDRVSAAAAFALEDQLAGPADEQHIAVSLQRTDGTVEAIVADRGLVTELATRFERIVAEPALAPRPPQQRWGWYVSGADGGFVRKPDGSAFATSEHHGVPAELTLALEHARRAGSAPVAVEMAFIPDEATQAAVAHYPGTKFLPISPWRWDAMDGTVLAGATDLCQGEFSRTSPNVKGRSSRLFRVAAALAFLAIVLHVAASLGEWVSMRFEDWRAKSAVASLAREAGYVGSDDPATAFAGRYSQARHLAGLSAPADALPLLARAAPALAALPAGMLKSATYADGHWTFDLAKLDVSTTRHLEQQLASAGLATLQAANPQGARMRVALAPGMQ